MATGYGRPLRLRGAPVTTAGVAAMTVGTSGGALATQFGFDEPVDVAVENGIDIARLHLGAEILHQLIGGHDVRPDLTPPGHVGLGPGEGVELTAAFGALALRHLRP